MKRIVLTAAVLCVLLAGCAKKADVTAAPAPAETTAAQTTAAQAAETKAPETQAPETKAPETQAAQPQTPQASAAKPQPAAPAAKPKPLTTKQKETAAAEGTAAEGMEERTIYHGMLKYRVPDSWTDYRAESHVEDDQTYWTEFHEQPDYDNEGSGWLCSIIQFPDNDVTKYGDIPHFDYIGQIESEDGTVAGLVVAYPSDVQPTLEQKDKYFAMYDDIPKLINSIEALPGAELFRGKGGISEYILPYSNIYWPLSDYELEELSSEELRLARNEIYARHGRRFKDKEIQAYFNSRSWYRGTIDPDKFDESVLTEAERENLKRIEAFEKKKGQ